MKKKKSIWIAQWIDSNSTWQLVLYVKRSLLKTSYVSFITEILNQYIKIGKFMLNFQVILTKLGYCSVLTFPGEKSHHRYIVYVVPTILTRGRVNAQKSSCWGIWSKDTSWVRISGHGDYYTDLLHWLGMQLSFVSGCISVKGCLKGFDVLGFFLGVKGWLYDVCVYVKYKYHI